MMFDDDFDDMEDFHDEIDHHESHSDILKFLAGATIVASFVKPQKKSWENRNFQSQTQTRVRPATPPLRKNNQPKPKIAQKKRNKPASTKGTHKRHPGHVNNEIIENPVVPNNEFADAHVSHQEMHGNELQVSTSATKVKGVDTELIIGICVLLVALFLLVLIVVIF